MRLCFDMEAEQEAEQKAALLQAIRTRRQKLNREAKGGGARIIAGRRSKANYRTLRSSNARNAAQVSPSTRL